MPELPEVETLKRELSKVLPGQKFKGVEVRHSKLVAPQTPDQFTSSLIGRKIVKVERRAKMLIIALDNDSFLVFHLKMTGQVIFSPASTASKKNYVIGGHPQPGGILNLPNQFTHIIFSLTGGATLYFNDMRRFGWARVYDVPSFEAATKHLGVEPLSRNFDLAHFKKELLKYPKRSLKQALLDQTVVAGIGNIYADEACFLAKINPTRLVGSLSPTDFKNLHQSLIAVLKLSISKKGTSSKNYLRSTGEPGGFSAYLNVYGRGKEKCTRCKHQLVKINFRGRGTHFCPNCQK